jgi:Protein of unknown function (DUF2800)
MTSSQLKAHFKSYMKVKDADKDHAVLSASGSERWLGCPGSIRESKGITTIDGEWSIAGTHAHTLLQFILEHSVTWEELLQSKESQAFKDFINYSNEQLENVLLAVRYVLQQKAKMYYATNVKPTLLIEQKVELAGVGFGTADVILFQPFGVLHVMDYKNGRSVVEPEDNTQALYYAHAVADKYGWDFRELWITIMQPNATHKRGPIRTWKTSMDRLEKEGKRFLIGAKRTRDPKAPLVMNTKWCWFCPARPTCPEQTQIKAKAILPRFERNDDYHGKEQD